MDVMRKCLIVYLLSAGPFIGGGPAWRQRLGPFSIVPAQHPPCLRRDRIKMDVLLVIATMYADVGPTYCGQMTGSIAEPWMAGEAKGV